MGSDLAGVVPCCFLDHAGDAKVGEDDAVVCVDEAVVWLEVAEDDVDSVEVAEALGHVLDKGEEHVVGEVAVVCVECVAERAALVEIHDDARESVLGVRVAAEAADAGGGGRGAGQDLELFLKGIVDSLQLGGRVHAVSGAAVVDDLDGNRPVLFPVCLVDDAKLAAAQDLFERQLFEGDLLARLVLGRGGGRGRLSKHLEQSLEL